MNDRITVRYRLRCPPGEAEARARVIAAEQSVELDPALVADDWVRANVLGRVEAVEPDGTGGARATISLALSTTGPEAGQLLNMLFGNTSIHEDVVLEDADFPPAALAAFGGPNRGADGLRAMAGAEGRAMTCSALKPQGLPPAALAGIAGALALGRIDFVKDDHGLADQTYSPFALRVPAVAAKVREANRATGGRTHYIPSLSGDLDRLREQARIAREEGLKALLLCPMVVGLPSFHALVRAFPDMAFMAHPAMAGAARIAPPFLLGRLFRLMGADATIFPNHGGRFGYSPQTCRDLASQALAPWGGIAPCLPVPAGGMSLARVPEMLDFYGPDAMLLIGGGLLAAGDRLAEETAAFVARVAEGTGGEA